MLTEGFVSVSLVTVFIQELWYCPWYHRSMISWVLDSDIMHNLVWYHMHMISYAYDIIVLWYHTSSMSYDISLVISRSYGIIWYHVTQGSRCSGWVAVGGCRAGPSGHPAALLSAGHGSLLLGRPATAGTSRFARNSSQWRASRAQNLIPKSSDDRLRLHRLMITVTVLSSPKYYSG